MSGVTFRGMPTPGESGRLVVLGWCLGLPDPNVGWTRPSAAFIADEYARHSDPSERL